MRNDRMFWERFRTAYPVKATALMLIAVMGFLACGGREAALNQAFDRVSYDTLPAKAPRPTKPVEKLHDAVTELKGLLAVQAERDLSEKQVRKAAAARKRIDGELAALRGQFKADEAKLGKLGAKAALKRLAEIETKMGGLEAQLRTALAQVPADGSRERNGTVRAAGLLAQLSPDQPHQPLSSNLGFGANNADPRPASLSAGITPAYAAPAATETASSLPRAAEAADLAETPETTITPEVHQLAEQLGHDPVRIYEYVRNTIRYEPYHGIRKGASQTLAERSGSSADQAALLIALLRDSGVHARFVQGTVQLPADEAANWLGVDTAAGERLEAAPDILASAGIPATQIRANGQLTKVRFEHFWAEAYVQDQAYRGVGEQLGDKTWLPLDPSIKASEFTAPSQDFAALAAPMAEDLAGDFIAAASPTEDGSALDPAPAAMRNVIMKERGAFAELLEEAQTSGDQDAADIVGSTTIRQSSAQYLPSSLPAQALSVSAERRAIPAHLTSRVTFSVAGSDPFAVPDRDPEDTSGAGFTYTVPTTDLANKRITLGYVPATEADAAIIDAYHGLLNAPSYAAALIPVLRVDGQVVARGRTAVSTGYTQTFEITYRAPGYSADTVTNPVFVGSLSAVGLDLGSVPGSQLKARAVALRQLAPSVTPANVLTDAHGGEMLSQLAALYFVRNDAINSVLARVNGVHQNRDLSGAITATSITPRYIGSFPVSVAFDGLSIDVDQDSQVVVAKRAGAPEAMSTYLQVSGMSASSSEAAIFEHALGWGAVSTTRVLAEAADAGVSIHHVTGENSAAVLSQMELPAAIEEDIAEAVSTPGVTVIAPRTEVTIGGWSGVGYIVSAGASTDYRITGGLSGGVAPSPLSSGNPFGPLSDSVGEFTYQVEDAVDCDLLKLRVFAFLMTVFCLIALAIFAAGTGPAGVLLASSALLAQIEGGALLLHLGVAAVGPGLLGALSGVIAAGAAEDC